MVCLAGPASFELLLAGLEVWNAKPEKIPAVLAQLASEHVRAEPLSLWPPQGLIDSSFIRILYDTCLEPAFVQALPDVSHQRTI
jgi:hypothetical protein